MVKTLHFHCRGSGVQFLGRELISHMPPGTVKKKKKKKKGLCFLRDAGHFMTVLLVH